MEGRHTKGQWVICKNNPQDIHIRQGEKGKVIFNVIDDGIIRTSGRIDPEAEANANLIAAAPELLEALEATRQFIIDNMDKLPNSEAIRLQGLKAINHATGEVKK